MAVSEKALKNLRPAKKGEVRNPHGRPKGSKSSGTILNRFLGIEAPRSIARIAKRLGWDGQITIKEAILLAQINRAIKGNIESCKLILDRTEGKVKNTLDANLSGSTTVIIENPANLDNV